MTTLTRWDPFREVMTLRGAMDRLFDNTLQSMDMQTEGNGNAMALALDVSEDEQGYVIHASVPGVAEDELDITFNNRVLTILGEFKHETEQEGVRYHLRERRSGKFSRSITLPTAIDEEAIKADFENGVLTVHLPKAEAAKPRRIAVQTAKTVEANGS